MPSWCVDWRDELWQPTAFTCQFSASGTATRPIASYEGTEAITISGIMVGKIREIRRAFYLDSNPDMIGACGQVFRDLQELCVESLKQKPNVYQAYELEEAVWRIPIRDHEMPAGSLSKTPCRAAPAVSQRRYLKFLRLVRSFEALGRFNSSFEKPNKQGVVSTIWMWTLRAFWFSKCIFLLADYGLARYRFLSRCRWWTKFAGLSIQTWAFWYNAEETAALREQRDAITAEWNATVLNTPEMYLYTMSPNYPTRMFMTEQGYIGLGPASARTGDIICIFCGAKAPHILRPRSQDRGGGYQVVGEAYVHGIMDGEYLEGANRETEQFQLF